MHHGSPMHKDLVGWGLLCMLGAGWCLGVAIGSHPTRHGLLCKVQYESCFFKAKAFCMMLNKFREPPGNARLMLQSYPSILCHFLTGRSFYVGKMILRILPSQATLWGGRWMVIVLVLMIHPKMSLIVDQETSPCQSFLQTLVLFRTDHHKSRGVKRYHWPHEGGFV